ncbi:MAG: hypothetical protein QOH79_495 [Acidimicrobiaceae bacterium]
MVAGRRALPVVAATGGALALLANFHTSPASSATVSAAGTAATTTTIGAQPKGTSPSTSTTATTTPGGTRTVDGPVASNEYGDVQVRVTLKGSQVVDVQALQLPHDRSRSARISDAAGPILRTEALQAQSAQIDLVSGATYTSESYAESLQGALDKAGR